MKVVAPAFREWRADAADRCSTVAGVLSALILTDAIQPDHVDRVRCAAGVLLDLARSLKRETLGPWLRITAREVGQRLRPALRDLRIVARWHRTRDEQGLADLGLVLGDLEELQEQARVLAGLAHGTREVPCA